MSTRRAVMQESAAAALPARNGDTLEPDNPYSQGSGHYAGFEWAESRDPSVCGGNSPSFIDGCEEYQRQAAAYAGCTTSP